MCVIHIFQIKIHSINKADSMTFQFNDTLLLEPIVSLNRGFAVIIFSKKILTFQTLSSKKLLSKNECQ